MKRQLVVLYSRFNQLLSAVLLAYADSEVIAPDQLLIAA